MQFSPTKIQWNIYKVNGAWIEVSLNSLSVTSILLIVTDFFVIAFSEFRRSHLRETQL